MYVLVIEFLLHWEHRKGLLYIHETEKVHGNDESVEIERVSTEAVTGGEEVLDFQEAKKMIRLLC